MNEPTIKFDYIWKATFKGKVIAQHPNDLYSKHDPSAEWNPSSFRDFQDYFQDHADELEKFELISRENTFTVDLSTPDKPKIYCDRRGRWGSSTNTLLHKEKRPLHDLRMIYYRKMEVTVRNGRSSLPRVLSYTLGYQGLDENGNNRQKTVTVI